MYDDLGCIGFEVDLYDCFYGYIGYYNCEYFEDVGVICGRLNLFFFLIDLKVMLWN